MKIALIIAGLFLVYWIIGYVVIKVCFKFNFLFPWYMEDDTACVSITALIWPLWVIIFLFYLVWIFVSSTGDKICSVLKIENENIDEDDL